MNASNDAEFPPASARIGGAGRILFAFCVATPIILWVTTIIGFFPGSVDYDFPITIREAETLVLQGQQSPVAALVLHIIGFGRYFVAPLFLLQVTATYGAVSYAVWKSRSPSTGLAILVLCSGPLVLILAPTLRLSYSANAFISLAVALGLFGRGRLSLIGAIASLSFASLLSSGFEVGYLFTIVLISTCRFPRRPVIAHLLAGAIFIGGSTVVAQGLLIAYGAGSVDRSATLYQQKLADIAGIYSLTGELCLDGRVTRTGASPKIALDRSYRFGVIKNAIWQDPDGFVDTPSLEQNELVDKCWRYNLMMYPGAVIVFKYNYLLETFRNGWFAGYFTYGEPRDNTITRFVIYLNDASYKGNWANLLYYIGIFSTISAISALVGTVRAIKIAVWGALGAAGFLLPNIIFSPEAIARYTIVPMSFLCWMSAVQFRDIAEEFSICRTRDRLRAIGRLLLGLDRPA